jgi:hypothetical protein
LITLNLFYAEPDPDRWLRFDRYPRRLARRIARGAAQPGGQARVFLNLRAGLDRLGAVYRVNDYRYARANPGALACIVGKPFLLERQWENPILFGAAVYSHPVDDPLLLDRLAVRRVLVPGPWMEEMCRPAWGAKVRSWPVGIDTDLWLPAPGDRSIDVLLYDKVRWDHDAYDTELIQPVRRALAGKGLAVQEFRYGAYREEAFREALRRSRAMVFLCEHETQGLAYQQALSSGVPILAWDRRGPWRDPSYYPHKVVFEPVTSVPYFDERCGLRFSGAGDFAAALDGFWEGVCGGAYAPREYILENLTLEAGARAYLAHVGEVS